jgi:hypothetical protein
MAISITTYTLSATFESIHLVMDAGLGNTFTELTAYINDGYLNNPVDLTDLLQGTQVEDLTIDMDDLLIVDDGTGTIKGIITIHAVASDDSTKERALYNLYYINLVLANMIVNKEVQQGFSDISTIYWLIRAIDIYINQDVDNQNITKAVNVYSRLLTMCEKNPSYLVDEDTEISAGSGEFIINGTYIIEK